MPVFATPNGFWHYFFSDMRELSRGRRIRIAIVIFIGLLTVTLPFFSYESPTSNKVTWSGLDVAHTVVTGSTDKVLPRMRFRIDRSGSWFGGLDPFYVVGFCVAYSALLLSGVVILMQPLRRVLRLSAPIGAIGAFSCVGRRGLTVFTGLDRVHSGVGPFMLVVASVIVLLMAETEPPLAPPTSSPESAL